MGITSVFVGYLIFMSIIIWMIDWLNDLLENT